MFFASQAPTLNGLKARSWSSERPSGTVTGTLCRVRLTVLDIANGDVEKYRTAGLVLWARARLASRMLWCLREIQCLPWSNWSRNLEAAKTPSTGYDVNAPPSLPSKWTKLQGQRTRGETGMSLWNRILLSII